jgi:hypothetical protein
MLTDQNMILVGAAVLLLFIIALVVMIVRQQQQINRLKQPKYGFLGKPLAGAMATLLMAGGILGGLYLVNNQDQSLDYRATAGEGSFNIVETCLGKSADEEAVDPEFEYQFEIDPIFSSDIPVPEAGEEFQIFMLVDPNTVDTQTFVENYVIEDPNDLNLETVFTVDVEAGVHTYTISANIGDTQWGAATGTFNVSEENCG